MNAKRLQKLLPARREFVHDLGIGAAVAGVSGFVAANLFPAQAEHPEHNTEKARNIKAASDTDIGPATDNSAIVLAPLGFRNFGSKPPRRRLAARRKEWTSAQRSFRRAAVAIGGGVLVLVGLVGLALPVLPGTVFLIAGLLLWSTEFPWARRLLVRTRKWIKART